MRCTCFQQLLGVYSVSKTALLGLTKAAAKDLASENIRVNCVAPGIVATKFSAVVSTTCCSFTIRNEVLLEKCLLLLREIGQLIIKTSVRSVT
jgi:short-subunit dehydrogenase